MSAAYIVFQIIREFKEIPFSKILEVYSNFRN